MDREEILANIEYWRQRIGEASAKWGGAEICGVSKTVDAETVNMAWDGGIRILHLDVLLIQGKLLIYLMN